MLKFLFLITVACITYPTDLLVKFIVRFRLIPFRSWMHRNTLLLHSGQLNEKPVTILILSLLHRLRQLLKFEGLSPGHFQITLERSLNRVWRNLVGRVNRVWRNLVGRVNRVWRNLVRRVNRVWRDLVRRVNRVWRDLVGRVNRVWRNLISIIVTLTPRWLRPLYSTISYPVRLIFLSIKRSLLLIKRSLTPYTTTVVYRVVRYWSRFLKTWLNQQRFLLQTGQSAKNSISIQIFSLLVRLRSAGKSCLQLVGKFRSEGVLFTIKFFIRLYKRRLEKKAHIKAEKLLIQRFLNSDISGNPRSLP